MSKFSFFILALFFTACLNEKNIDPANAPTFTRYFSDGFANEPVAVEETNDKGFIILINTNFKNTDAEDEQERIEIIKTDQFGHQLWQHYYPGPESVTPGVPVIRWKASSIIVLGSGGYLVTGEQIQGSGTTKQMLLFVVDDNGENMNSKVYPATPATASFTARAATVAPATVGSGDNFFLLGQSPDITVTDNIYLAEINSSTLDPVWIRYYDGKGSPLELSNKLFYQQAAGIFPPYLYWAGNRTLSGGNVNSFVTQIRLNEASTENGLQEIGAPSESTYGLDFCRKGTGFGLVGYVEAAGNLGNIFFCPVTASGTPGDIKPFINDIFDNPGALDENVNVKEEKGNAITSTNDGGYMILGTIDTYTGLLGRGNTDMLLMKINGFGDKVWSNTFGTPDVDTGISIRQTSDGGYLILGVTRLAALKTVVLIKTDKDGLVD